MTTFETSEHLTTKLYTDGTLELVGLEETHCLTKQEAIELALQILQNDYENGDFDHCKFCDGWIKVHEEDYDKCCELTEQLNESQDWGYSRCLLCKKPLR